MPRRGGVPKRDVLPDPIYGSKVVTKLVNQIMLDGKKGVAQNIVYTAFETMQAKTGQDAMEVFNQAMANVMPLLEVKATSYKLQEKSSGAAVAVVLEKYNFNGQPSLYIEFI